MERMMKSSGSFEDNREIAKGGVATPFPYKLLRCLQDVEKEGNAHIISWQPHGRAFIVHDPELFVQQIMPRYFGQTKFASFQRQLNIYGFSRFIKGVDKGSYYHRRFIRDNPSCAQNMTRIKVKGEKSLDKRRIQNCDVQNEPDFYLPEWANHLEPCIPPSLEQRTKHKKSDQVVTPASSPSPIPPSERKITSRVSGSTNLGATLPPFLQENNELSAQDLQKICQNMGLDPAELEPRPLPEKALLSTFKLLDRDLNIYAINEDSLFEKSRMASV